MPSSPFHLHCCLWVWYVCDDGGGYDRRRRSRSRSNSQKSDTSLSPSPLRNNIRSADGRLAPPRPVVEKEKKLRDPNRITRSRPNAGTTPGPQPVTAEKDTKTKTSNKEKSGNKGKESKDEGIYMHKP
jgi:type IV secretory pathway VirB10-like protein